MSSRLLQAACLFPLPLIALHGAEITTGHQLGPKYDQRAFYIRSNSREAWRKTSAGGAFRPEAAGKLMNLRIAQALFHDEWMKERPFDPERNTDALIRALDVYQQHGVLMINICLQGGQAGYDSKVNGVDRQNGYRYGPAKGTYVSAFLPDGSLKPAWLARLERLLRAADRRGMVVGLMYFYQGQDEQFSSTGAIHAGARNITEWIARKDFRNVILDVANEWDLGSGWDFDRYIPRNIERLIVEIRERFRELRPGYVPPVSVSSDGRMLYPESLMRVVDLVIIHGNGRTPDEKRRRAAELANVAKPVLMNEDDNGRASTLANLARERASCTIFFEQAGGWGYMPWVQAQRFPFRYMPAATAEVRDELPEAERDMVYFHAVLDHIAELTLTQPLRGGKGR